MTSRRLHIVFVSAALAWAALIVVAPFLASRAHASTFGAALTLAVYAIGGIVCHQLPERSFHVWAAQMPVCARCTGIYLGATAFAPLALRRARAVMALGAGGARAFTASGGRSAERSARLRSRAWNRLLLVSAALPSAATLVFEWTTGVAPSNWIRFAAGVPIGAAVAWLVRAATEDQVNY